MTAHTGDPYASHLTPLALTIAASIGPLVEFGAGRYSTPLLHSHQMRGVMSFEPDATWAHAMAQTGLRIRKWPEFPQLPVELPHSIGVAFIDCAPEGSRAKVAMQLVARDVGYVVLHDADPEWESAYGYQELLEHFRNAWTWDLFRPHTLVLSNKYCVSPWGRALP